MLLDLSPSAQITNNFSPSFKPTATIIVRACTSKEVGESFWLSAYSHSIIRSKLIDATWSYLIALIFFSPDKTNISFLVGSRAISRIFFTNIVEVRIDCTGERRVYISVSCRSRLNIMGKSLPCGREWEQGWGLG